MKESATASQIRLFAAHQGIHLWRNNNGAFQDSTGRWVRFGICNDSPKLAEKIKSSDYIGIRPLLITPEWVGHVVGVFTAVETKPPLWTFNPSDSHTIGQSNFHDIVRQSGGFAGFARNIDDFKRIVLL